MPVEKTRATSIILFCCQCVPLPIRKLFFKSLLMLFYHAVAKHRLIALHNLRCAFPEKDMEELNRIAKGVYRNLAITAAEFFSLPSITRENLHEWVELEGLEHFEAGIAQGKGLLTIIAHFGNWELMPVTVPLLLKFPKPSYIVYRPLDSPVLDNMIEHVRTINGNEMIPKGGSGKRIMELLKENHAIAILSDQNVAAREGVFVDFFGRPACTGVGLAVLALRSGAPVLPMFMARQKSGKYKFILKPLVEISQTGDYEKDLLENTQRFTKVVEDVVREYPDQWFWIHQRWKTKKWQIGL
ncbi:MAG: lysophospholipid acyltransferase family protein [Deltaproteobacteria bacterium]|nr:lysophospholipid acyltransferase family protein [Deltaproteobacteria bacterium]